MSRVKTGDRFGRLTVQYVEGKSKNRAYMWRCMCDCGSVNVVRSDALLRGLSKSCGCLAVEVARELALTRPVIHGHARNGKTSPEYSSWRAMITRCCMPNTPGYSDYGGRGISVCNSWRNNFANFLSDMGNRPPFTSLERIDVNGNYSKANCRWATDADQSRNTRRTIRVIAEGLPMCLKDACSAIGANYSSVRKTISRGKSPQEAIDFYAARLIRGPYSRHLIAKGITA